MNEPAATRAPAERNTPFLARTTSFVRRGMRMTRSQARAWDRLADRYVLPFEHAGGSTTVATGQRIDLDSLRHEVGLEGSVVVEIGTGTGDQIVHAARTHPEQLFLGFEVWRPGIAQALLKAEDAGVTNVRFIEADAEQALPILLPARSVSEVWTFFPDPWRKTRHHKRRLVKPSFASAVAAILEPGGAWRLATDWRSYATDMIHVLAAHHDFDLYSRGRFPGRTLTKFEQRAQREGRFPFDLTAVRRDIVGDDAASQRGSDTRGHG